MGNMLFSFVEEGCEKLRDATILFADCFTPACVVDRIVLCLGACVIYVSPFCMAGRFRLMGKATGGGGITNLICLDCF